MPTTRPLRDEADQALIDRWLHGRSAHTRRAYAGDVAAVLAIAGKPLAELQLADLQAVADRLLADGLARTTVARRLAAVKSLLKFAHQTGELAGDVGRALRLPSRPSTLAERIVDEEAIAALLAAAVAYVVFRWFRRRSRERAAEPTA